MTSSFINGSPKFQRSLSPLINSPQTLLAVPSSPKVMARPASPKTTPPTSPMTLRASLLSQRAKSMNEFLNRACEHEASGNNCLGKSVSIDSFKPSPNQSSQIFNSEKWNSAALLTPEDILSLATKYDEPLESAINKFAEDITGTSRTNLSLQKFVGQVLGLKPLHLSINPVTPGLTTGISGQPVYIIRDKETSEALFIIKSDTPNLIADEINGLRLIKRQKMDCCRCPEVLGIGKTVGQDEKEVAFFAQTVAPGISIGHYFEKAAQPEGVGKLSAEEDLKEAVILMAKGMAELHNQKVKGLSGRSTDSICSKSKYYKKQLNLFLANAEVHNALAQRAFLKMQEIYEDGPLVSNASIIHGDFHPGNVFYPGGRSSFITLIDNGGIVYSLSHEGHPDEFAGYDFAYCLQWIGVMAKMYDLDKTFAASLQKAFEDQYMNSRVISDANAFKKEVKFMKMYTALERIRQLTDVLKEPSHQWNTTLGRENVLKIHSILLEEVNSA